MQEQPELSARAAEAAPLLNCEVSVVQAPQLALGGKRLLADLHAAHTVFLTTKLQPQLDVAPNYYIRPSAARERS